MKEIRVILASFLHRQDRKEVSPMAKLRFSIAAALVAVVALGSSNAHAGFITEQDLTPIYSANPPFTALTEITVYWLAPTITITSVNYNNLNSLAVETALFGLPGTVVQGYYGNNSGTIQNITLPNSPTVDVFFIDSITFCGDEGTGIDGCADNIPGKSFAVVSTVAAGVNGAELEAHELGHDLGLVHCPPNCGGVANLMDASGYGSTTLTAAQAAIVLASGLVQVDAFGDNYIELQAIRFVPAPATLVLFGLAVALLLFVQLWRRRASNHGVLQSVSR